MGVGDDFNQPDLAGAGQMGAAAGTAVAARLHQPHIAGQFLFAAVFGPRQRLGVGYPAVHRGVRPYGGVGLGLRLCQLGGGQGDAGVHPHIGRADVEADILRPEQPVERPTQDVLTGVLLHGVQPCGPVEAALHRVTRRQRGIGGVGDGYTVRMYGQYPRRTQRAGVTGLAAALREEGRAVQHHGEPTLRRGAGQNLCGKILHIWVCFVYFLRHGNEILSFFVIFSYYNIKQV